MAAKFVCQLCPYWTSKSRKLDRHVKARHFDTAETECDLCKFRAIDPAWLRLHIRREHGDPVEPEFVDLGDESGEDSASIPAIQDPVTRDQEADEGILMDSEDEEEGRVNSVANEHVEPMDNVFTNTASSECGQNDCDEDVGRSVSTGEMEINKTSPTQNQEFGEAILMDSGDEQDDIVLLELDQESSKVSKEDLGNKVPATDVQEADEAILVDSGDEDDREVRASSSADEIVEGRSTEDVGRSIPTKEIELAERDRDTGNVSVDKVPSTNNQEDDEPILVDSGDEEEQEENREISDSAEHEERIAHCSKTGEQNNTDDDVERSSSAIEPDVVEISEDSIEASENLSVSKDHATQNKDADGDIPIDSGHGDVQEAPLSSGVDEQLVSVATEMPQGSKSVQDGISENVRKSVPASENLESNLISTRERDSERGAQQQTVGETLKASFQDNLKRYGMQTANDDPFKVCFTPISKRKPHPSVRRAPKANILLQVPDISDGDSDDEDEREHQDKVPCSVDKNIAEPAERPTDTSPTSSNKNVQILPGPTLIMKRAGENTVIPRRHLEKKEKKPNELQQKSVTRDKSNAASSKTPPPLPPLPPQKKVAMPWYAGTEYQCRLCKDLYFYIESLRRHVKRVHGDVDAYIDREGNFETRAVMYSCQLCSEVMKRNFASVSGHLGVKHDMTMLEYESRFNLVNYEVEVPADVNVPPILLMSKGEGKKVKKATTLPRGSDPEHMNVDTKEAPDILEAKAKVVNEKVARDSSSKCRVCSDVFTDFNCMNKGDFEHTPTPKNDSPASDDGRERSGKDNIDKAQLPSVIAMSDSPPSIDMSDSHAGKYPKGLRLQEAESSKSSSTPPGCNRVDSTAINKCKPTAAAASHPSPIQAEEEISNPDGVPEKGFFCQICEMDCGKELHVFLQCPQVGRDDGENTSPVSSSNILPLATPGGNGGSRKSGAYKRRRRNEEFKKSPIEGAAEEQRKRKSVTKEDEPENRGKKARLTATENTESPELPSVPPANNVAEESVRLTSCTEDSKTSLDNDSESTHLADDDDEDGKEEDEEEPEEELILISDEEDGADDDNEEGKKVSEPQPDEQQVSTSVGESEDLARENSDLKGKLDGVTTQKNDLEKAVVDLRAEISELRELILSGKGKKDQASSGRTTPTTEECPPLSTRPSPAVVVDPEGELISLPVEVILEEENKHGKESTDATSSAEVVSIAMKEASNTTTLQEGADTILKLGNGRNRPCPQFANQGLYSSMALEVLQSSYENSDPGLQVQRAETKNIMTEKQPRPRTSSKMTSEFKCRLCNRVYGSPGELRDHTSYNHACAKCNQEFKSRHFLLKHQIVCLKKNERISGPTGELEFCCTMCRLVSSNREAYLEHFWEHMHKGHKVPSEAEENPLDTQEREEMDEVDQDDVVQLSDKLPQPRKVSKMTSQFKCRPCNKAYETKKCLKKHMVFNHICAKCKQGRKSRFFLLKHLKLCLKSNERMNWNTGVLEHCCAMCPRVFTMGEAYDEHVVEHMRNRDMARSKVTEYPLNTGEGEKVVRDDPLPGQSDVVDLSDEDSDDGGSVVSTRSVTNATEKKDPTKDKAGATREGFNNQALRNPNPRSDLAVSTSKEIFRKSTTQEQPLQPTSSAAHEKADVDKDDEWSAGYQNHIPLKKTPGYDTLSNFVSKKNVKANKDSLRSINKSLAPSTPFVPTNNANTNKDDRSNLIKSLSTKQISQDRESRIGQSSLSLQPQKTGNSENLTNQSNKSKSASVSATSPPVTVAVLPNDTANPTRNNNLRNFRRSSVREPILEHSDGPLDLSKSQAPQVKEQVAGPVERPTSSNSNRDSGDPDVDDAETVIIDVLDRNDSVPSSRPTKWVAKKGKESLGVQMILDPFYNSRKISRDTYNKIMRKCVEKISQMREGSMDFKKIQELVFAHVRHYQRAEKERPNSSSSSSAKSELVQGNISSIPGDRQANPERARVTAPLTSAAFGARSSISNGTTNMNKLGSRPRPMVDAKRTYAGPSSGRGRKKKI